MSSTIFMSFKNNIFFSKLGFAGITVSRYGTQTCPHTNRGTAKRDTLMSSTIFMSFKNNIFFSKLGFAGITVSRLVCGLAPKAE